MDEVQSPRAEAGGDEKLLKETFKSDLIENELHHFGEKCVRYTTERPHRVGDELLQRHIIMFR